MALRLPEQLASSSDPIVSPAFMHRSAPARSYPPQELQQQNMFFPAAPLASFVSQEAQGYPPQPHSQAPVALLSTSAAIVSDDDSFLNDVLAEQEEDNRPVGIYGAPAGAAVWPELGGPPLGPGMRPAAVSGYLVSEHLGGCRIPGCICLFGLVLSMTENHVWVNCIEVLTKPCQEGSCLYEQPWQKSSPAFFISCLRHNQQGAVWA